MQPPKSELHKLVKLAVPVVLSQLGNISMGIVDTFVVGQAGSLDLAGIAAGNSFFWPVAVVAIGLLLGMDTIISQAFGKKDQDRIHACLGLGLTTSLIISLILGPAIYLYSDYLTSFGVTEDIATKATPYLKVMAYSIPFLIIFNCVQKYWQAQELALPVTILIIAANILNYLLDEAFVMGRWGFPQLGAEGVAYSTMFCRIFLLAAIMALSAYLWSKKNRYSKPSLKSMRAIDGTLRRQFFFLSVPAATQIGLEVFAFNVITIIVASLNAVTLAAHHIVLNIATATFMFPMGVAIATSIRVGTHWGSDRHEEAAKAGTLGIKLSAAIMLVFGGILYFIPEVLIGYFTSDLDTINKGLEIIILCACFQVVDGIQVTTGGALRGLGDTKTSLYTNTIGFYFFGLPISLISCFYLDWGLQGLWLGLASGLTLVAILNSYFWRRRLLHSK